MNVGLIVCAISVFGFIGFLIWLIIRIVQWDSKWPAAVGMLGCVVVFLAGAVLTVIGAVNSDEQVVEFNKEDCIPAPLEIYNTLAEENGLGETHMFVDGVVELISSKKGAKYCEIQTKDGIINMLSVPLGTPASEWERLEEGKRIRVYFQYMGYSSVLDGASGMLLGIGKAAEEGTTVSGTPYTEPVEEPEDDSGIWASKYTPISDFRYTLDKKEKTITLNRYIGDDEKILLSKTYTIGGEDYNLVSLGDGACFLGEIRITSIYVPEGVTHLGAATFNSCSSLQHLYIPSTMEDLPMDFLDYIHEYTLFCNAETTLPAERDTTNYEESTEEFSQAEELGRSLGGALNGIIGGITSDPDHPIVTEIYFGGSEEQWESHK